MRIRRFKKIAAAVMAAVLAIGSIPVMGLAQVNAAEPEVTKTINFDLSGVAPVDKTETDFVAGDVPVIATGKVSVKVTDTPVVNEKGVEYTKWINTGGAGNTAKRAMKIVLPTTSKVTVWALSNSADEERGWVIADSAAKVVAEYSGAKLGDTVSGVSTILPAGTYYIYALKSVNFYDIDIQWSLGFDLSGVAAVDKTETDFTAGDVPVIATGKVSVKETDTPVVNEHGVEYKKWINTGGAGNTAKRAIKVILPTSCELTVWALSNSADEERGWVIADADAKVVAEYNGAKLGTTVNGVTTALPAGTYYIYALKSVNFYDVVANYAPIFDLNPGGAATEIETETAAGDFTLVGGSKDDGKNLTVDVPEGVSDAAGNAFTQRLKLNGSGSATKRAVKFTLDYKTSLDVYALSGGSGERTLNIEDATGKVVATVAAADKNNATVQPKTVRLAPGTYTIYSAGKGINIFDIRRTPDAVQCDWAEVETPQITSVTQSKVNGNFVVDFTGKVDKYEGADYIMISMQSNGKEVSSTKIVGKETSVEMVPFWNGDYSFTITAVREGESFKVGNTVEVKDFKLMLNAPKFRMLESIGGGKVYVDWVVNDYCKNYDVYYKLASAADYTKVTTTDKDEYTIEGLTTGSTYSIKVVAKEDGTDRTSEWVQDVLVTAKKADKNWNAALTGSGQTTVITVTDANGVPTEYPFDVSDESKDKTQVKDAVDVVNTTGKVAIKNTGGGKITNEEGFHYYYTMVDPNKENFKMTATFTIVDPKGYDGQSGFGIIATDVLGVNMFGDGTYVHKYFNSVGTYYYGISSKGMVDYPSFRYVTGHNNSDPSKTEGDERIETSKGFSGKTVIEAGKSYTFTLEKTNEKFIGTFDGQSIELNDTSILSVQEDGSIAVGVFAVRCMGVEISDIKFETSESTGVTAAVKDTKIAPDTRIYSTGTTGSADYEVIYASNVAGTLVVKAPDGTTKTITMTADSVARTTVKLTEGKNTVDTTFTPDKSADLTSYADITKSVTVEYKKVGVKGQSIWVSPDGKSDAAGTKADPMDLPTAVKYAQPGQTIVMMDGNYTKSVTIDRSVCGTANDYITLVAQNTGKAVFTGGAGLTVVGSYWHVYGIHVVGAAGVGIQVGGNYNIIEMCITSGCKNSGTQISRTQGSPTNKQGIEGLLWPSYNLIKNCESFDNCDAGKNDADGFAAKLTCGEGNKFYGCSAHNNIDDGWDLFAKVISGPIGTVTIENCIAYDNGALTDGSAVTLGEGNGFKLGGGYLPGGHVLKNSIAFNNMGKGITSNSCPDVEIYNCISYGNLTADGDGYNIGLNTMSSLAKEWVVEGVISMNTPANTKYADTVPFNLINEKNYIYNGSASFNSLGEEAVDDWFVSVDVSKKPTRNENGTINMGGLLELKEDFQTSHEGVGAVLDVTSDAAISVAPAISSIIPSGEEKDAVDEVEKSEDAVITDSEGKEITDEDIYMDIEALDATTITKFEAALKVAGVELSDDVKAEFFNITLEDKNGVKLAMKSGKLYVTFAYPDGTAQDTHSFRVYHMDGDKLEEVTYALTDEGIVMEADAFSPYAVVYEKAVTTGDTNNALPFAIAMMASMAAIAGAMYFGKKRRIFE